MENDKWYVKAHGKWITLKISEAVAQDIPEGTVTVPVSATLLYKLTVGKEKAERPLVPYLGHNECDFNGHIYGLDIYPFSSDIEIVRSPTNAQVYARFLCDFCPKCGKNLWEDASGENLPSEDTKITS